jgi:hypothetical protein
VTQQIINIGTAPNDGTGDPTRSAFDKCNLNFTELYQVSRPTGNAIEYQFNNTTTEPPSVGQIRFNQATQALTTKLWASHTTSSGVNIKQFLALATTGAKLVVQDKIDNTNYIKFNVTAAPVDKTTYWEFAVAATASSGNLPNAAILAAVTGGIDAAPFDAYSGIQINGSMDVSQENGTAQQTGIGYICDGWQQSYSGSMTLGSSQAPFTMGGFRNFLVQTVGIAQPSLGAGNFGIIYQQIEGYRIARLGWGTVYAQPITIGFYSKHHRPGLYSVSVRNGTVDRAYLATYAHSVADVEQYNFITIPGDVSGTWAAGNTAGMIIAFSLGAGSNFTAPSANTWLAGGYQAAPGQVNAVAATSDVFRITGVVVLPGIQAPTAAQSSLIMRPYDQELLTCQRYYYKRASGISGYNIASSAIIEWFHHPVTMRATPTVIAAGGAAENVGGGIVADNASITAVRNYTIITATGEGRVDNYLQTADARL